MCCIAIALYREHSKTSFFFLLYEKRRKKKKEKRVRQMRSTTPNLLFECRPLRLCWRVFQQESPRHSSPSERCNAMRPIVCFAILWRVFIILCLSRASYVLFFIPFHLLLPLLLSFLDVLNPVLTYVTAYNNNTHTRSSNCALLASPL